MFPDNKLLSSQSSCKNSNFPKLAEILPSSMGDCEDKMMLHTRLSFVQLIPPHEHGDASNGLQFPSKGDFTVKPFLNSIKAKPSEVKDIVMLTHVVRRLVMTKSHLKIGLNF
ncbi:hypothetical protein KC19_9G156900 [Ceratodon purpureus]|uniref:Uncharacterized protein n=1 Tax=Ceratodon purpureus TaxID=3225 RepID=A0A8T0GVY5_CERPU|nr:hypothetical protein KC19_9G156900 [Ceratodon purpureus]